MDAVLAHRETDARGVAADVVAGVVLGAVKEIHRAILDHGGRVEGMAAFPMHRLTLHGAIEDRRRVWPDDRLRVRRAGERSESPVGHAVGGLRGEMGGHEDGREETKEVCFPKHEET